jgi:high affinity Mn2+ porin
VWRESAVHHLFRIAAAIIWIGLCPGRGLQAQDLRPTLPPPAQAPPAPTPPSLAEADALADRLWLSVQANLIIQQHASLNALYSGANSLASAPEHAMSRVVTLYSGLRMTRQFELLFDVESAGGRALSDGRGLGAVTNVDAPAGPSLGAGPYIARAMMHYTLTLGQERTLATRNPLSLASTVPARRLEVRVGKMSPVDFFDLNSACNDSHSQFTNIAIVNNGAYDYASDARGYTFGEMVEFYDAAWAARFGEMLIPYGPDNTHPRWNLARAHSENVEVEYHTTTVLKRSSVIRALAFVNHSPTAMYRDAMVGYLAGQDSAPDTALHRKADVRKVGVGLNGEHAVSDSARAFWRFGWNDGASEPNPIDRSGEAGVDLRGDRWHRTADEVGAAFIANGLSAVHKRYLQAGGVSSGLGDGRLSYAPERTIELYYNAALWRGLSVTVAYQLVTHPGSITIAVPSRCLDSASTSRTCCRRNARRRVDSEAQRE